MARTPSRRKQKQGIDILRDKGIQGTVLGLFMLFAPAFFGATSPYRSVAIALRTPGWLFFGIGLSMLGAYFIFKRKLDRTGPEAALPRREMPASVREPVNAAKSEVPAKSTTWSPAVFAAIEWRRFEAFCEALFAQSGYLTRSQTHGADGGVDIWLLAPGSEEPVAVVQCKHWQGKPVGVKELREFFGVMASHKLTRGSYATTSTYTAEAQQFAKANGIAALDGAALLALIATRTPEQQQALLAVAYEGDYGRPTCASCGDKMVARTPSKGGAGFWGCSHYPRCRSRLPMLAAR